MKRRRPHDEEIFWSTPDSCSQIPREEMEEESHTPSLFSQIDSTSFLDAFHHEEHLSTKSLTKYLKSSAMQIEPEEEDEGSWEEQDFSSDIEKLQKIELELRSKKSEESRLNAIARLRANGHAPKPGLSRPIPTPKQLPKQIPKSNVPINQPIIHPPTTHQAKQPISLQKGSPLFRVPNLPVQRPEPKIGPLPTRVQSPPMTVASRLIATEPKPPLLTPKIMADRPQPRPTHVPVPKPLVQPQSLNVSKPTSPMEQAKKFGKQIPAHVPAHLNSHSVPVVVKPLQFPHTTLQKSTKPVHGVITPLQITSKLSAGPLREELIQEPIVQRTPLLITEEQVDHFQQNLSQPILSEAQEIELGIGKANEAEEEAARKREEARAAEELAIEQQAEAQRIQQERVAEELRQKQKQKVIELEEKRRKEAKAAKEVERQREEEAQLAKQKELMEAEAERKRQEEKERLEAEALEREAEKIAKQKFALEEKRREEMKEAKRKEANKKKQAETIPPLPTNKSNHKSVSLADLCEDEEPQENESQIQLKTYAKRKPQYRSQRPIGSSQMSASQMPTSQISTQTLLLDLSADSPLSSKRKDKAKKKKK